MLYLSYIFQLDINRISMYSYLMYITMYTFIDTGMLLHMVGTINYGW